MSIIIFSVFIAAPASKLVSSRIFSLLITDFIQHTENIRDEVNSSIEMFKEQGKH